MPRGVTVYTLRTAEQYPSGDSWRLEEDRILQVFDTAGRQLATFRADSWLRVESGAYAPLESQAAS